MGALVLLFLGVAVCFEARELRIGRISNPGAGFFPFWLGIGLVVCTGVLITKFIRSAGKKSSDDSGFWKGIAWGKVLLVVIGMLLYAFLLEPLGYLIATSFLMIFLFKTTESQRWLSVVVWSVAVSILTYVLFKVWLEVQFPVGFLGI